MISKIANGIAGVLLFLLIFSLAYHYTSWFKPAADLASSQVESVLGQVLPGDLFGKQASANQLNQARESYAQGNMNASVSAYQAYITKNPVNVDAIGELGNVYYSAGQMSEAAQAYYDAANLLIKQKQLERANELIPIVAQINPGLANTLTTNMAQAGQQE